MDCELSGAGPAFYDTWPGSCCLHRAAALAGIPGALVILIKRNKLPTKWGESAQQKALVEATHILIFKAGSVFPKTIKLLSQQKGKYLELAVNSWQALILTHYYTWEHPSCLGEKTSLKGGTVWEHGRLYCCFRVTAPCACCSCRDLCVFQLTGRMSSPLGNIPVFLQVIREEGDRDGSRSD